MTIKNKRKARRRLILVDLSVVPKDMNIDDFIKEWKSGAIRLSENQIIEGYDYKK